uniref:Peptidase_M24 domain-containing protein n=1 Tax=Panagrellus redivivus TaxID=6233 RepID=A0A7E4VL19_PANRE
MAYAFPTLKHGRTASPTRQPSKRDVCSNCGRMVVHWHLFQFCQICDQQGNEKKYDAYCSPQCVTEHWPIHKYVHESSDDAPKQFVLYPSFNYNIGNLRPYTLGPERDFPNGSSLKPPHHVPSNYIKNDRTMSYLFDANRIAREVMNEVANSVMVGINTASLEKVVHEACIDRNCYPALLGHQGFPRSCSTSINEVACGGVPDLRELEDGDILNVDVNVFYQGYYGCVSETFVVGEKVSQENRRLVRAAYETCQKAIRMIKPGKSYQGLIDAMAKHADSNGFAIIPEYRVPFHTTFYPILTENEVREFQVEAERPPEFKKSRFDNINRTIQRGDVFTIAPTLTYGDPTVFSWPDGATVTLSGNPVAQFKQTIRVNGHGCDILTENFGDKPYFIRQFEMSYPDESLDIFNVFEN